MRRRRTNSLDRAWTLILLYLRRLGRRRALAVATFGLLGLTGSGLFGIITSGPLPAVHDEFSYLLAADTYASGRLTNASHPHWVHFETYHVLMQPTYASKYPPAQGLVLALGQRIAGSPAAGVWFSAGLMSAAIAWMLLKWLPTQWAVLASILATVQLTWLSYWGHSYWGGAVAATGGALAFGALRMVVTHPRPAAGVVLGVGLGVLAASRPYEGAVAGLCLVVALGLTVRSAPPPERRRHLRAILAAGCVVAVTVGWLGYYNWRVTGSARTMPYFLYQAQYSANSLLLVGTPGERPSYRHPEMERFFREWGEDRQQRQRSMVGVLRAVPIKIGLLVVGLVGAGSVGLVGIPGIIRRRSLRFVFVTTAAVIGAALLTAGSYAHYIAPVTALIYVVLGAALCHLHRKARRHRSANFAIVAVCAFVPLAVFHSVKSLASPYRQFARDRAALASQLERLPAKSLVFVSYDPNHNPHQEWVQNLADIDGGKVAWARSMSARQNKELIDYFSDRRVWLIEPDVQIRLKPYSP